MTAHQGPADPKAYPELRRRLLLEAGDVEPHPGPRQRRRPVGAQGDVLVEDVTAATARTYERALGIFEEFAVLRGGGSLARLVEQGGLVLWATAYLRTGYAQRTLGHGAAGHLVSGVNRLLSLAMSLGAAPAAEDTNLRPLWRILRNWEKAVPAEFRRPVHRQAALALAATCMVLQQLALALLTLFSFHCLLRPREAAGLTKADVHVFTGRGRRLYPDVRAVVQIRRAKTRRRTPHAARQCVTVQDEGIAQALLAAQRGSWWTQELWPPGVGQILPVWKRALQLMRIEDSEYTPAGLRGGGATDLYLQTGDVPSLRRHGRWAPERTLERYLQEVCSLMIAVTQGARCSLV